MSSLNSSSWTNISSNEIAYDPCIPPVCPDETIIRLLSYQSSLCSGSSSTVSWTIDGNSNVPQQNMLLWSLNSLDFANEVGANNNRTSPYFTSFITPSSLGIMFFKIRSLIRGTFYESDIFSSTIIDCYDTGNCKYYVQAKLCQTTSCDYVTPSFQVYVNESGIPIIPSGEERLPVYFNNSNYCWYIDQDAINNKIPYGGCEGTYYIPSIYSGNNVVLETITNDYADCEECCNSLIINTLCPSDWVAVPDELLTVDRTSQAKFYIEYTTYEIRDHIRIYANYDSTLDCDEQEGDVLWDSGCVGTAFGEGPGVPLSARSQVKWLGNKSDIRADCFTVYNDQLPIMVEVEPNCDGSIATWWDLAIEGPNGLVLSIQDGDTPFCDYFN